jgi:hypothetical protein
MDYLAGNEDRPGILAWGLYDKIGDAALRAAQDIAEAPLLIQDRFSIDRKDAVVRS